ERAHPVVVGLGRASSDGIAARRELEHFLHEINGKIIRARRSEVERRRLSVMMRQSAESDACRALSRTSNAAQLRRMSHLQRSKSMVASARANLLLDRVLEI